MFWRKFPAFVRMPVAAAGHPDPQIVGTQAVFNVIMGERYKNGHQGVQGLVHGDYGKTPASPSRRVQRLLF